MGRSSVDSLRSKQPPSPAVLAARIGPKPSDMPSFTPSVQLTCDERESTWGLVCCRAPHQAGRHSGVNAAGTHEGYWGAGVLHVNRIEDVVIA
jgi:hypothetical protein